MKLVELERMVDALRRQWHDCEPKSTRNPRSLPDNAVSALQSIIDDLRVEEAG